MSESDASPPTTAEQFRDGIAAVQHQLATGGVVDEDLPAALYGLGRRHDALARTMLEDGDSESARRRYAEAAVYYLSSIRESEARRDRLGPRDRHDDAWTRVHAVDRALLSGADDIVECAGRVARRTDWTVLAEGDNESFYTAKLVGAVVRDDEAWFRFAEEFRHATRRDRHPFDEQFCRVLEGIAESDVDATARGLGGMLEATAVGDGEVPVPLGGADERIAALCRLAAAKGVDVTVDAATVPRALLPDREEATRVVTGDGTTDTDWRPTVHSDPATGQYTLVERVPYPEDGPLTPAALPETAAGHVLSEEWVDAVIERLRTSGVAGQETRGNSLAAARSAGDLKRRLVVLVAGSDADDYVIDPSLLEHGVDEVVVRADDPE
jgi:hypothetical protein